MPGLEDQLMDGEITLRPVRSPEDLARVKAATLAAKAGCHAPTHVFEKRTFNIQHSTSKGEVAGYASINAIPFLTGWFSDEHIDRVEARQCLAAMERIAAESGARIVVTPCTDDCRMRADMAALGYTAAGKVTLYFKNLNA